MIDLREEYSLKKFMPANSDVKTMSNVFYAFSDYTRLRIIILLTIRPLCVSDIEAVLNLNQTTISHQLKILRTLDLVSCDRNGKTITYYIKNQGIENLLNAGVDCI